MSRYRFLFKLHETYSIRRFFNIEKMKMKELFLTEPSLSYKDSFQSLVMEYLQSGEETYKNMYKPALANFNKYVILLKAHAQGKNLPAGEVAYSTYWLVTYYNHILGNIRLRHQSLPVYGNIGYDIRPSFRNNGYGTVMLKLAIEKAQQLEMNYLKIACDQRNKSSIKVIEKNGGVFIERVFDRKTRLFVNKYFIDL